MMRTQKLQQFASDNYSGICPDAFEYLERANFFHEKAYGEDKWTAKAADMFREIFETDCEVFFVFNGTAANSLSLAMICQPYHSIICHEVAHIETDECGAPEFFSNGSKILTGSGPLGKVTPEMISRIVLKRNDVHYPKPEVVSITQATEVGTVYSPDEIRAITDICKKFELKTHMDGARFANAVAQLNISPADITWKAGIDVLCFGGTKNGLAVGEAVIFFNKKLAREFDFRCKQAGQLSSKMRFIAAPWVGLLENNHWIKNAQHANDCAEYFHQQLSKIPEIEILFPRQANSLFLKLPEGVHEKMEERGWHFYNFIGVEAARLMCSWDTSKEMIDEFMADLKELIA